MNIWFEILDVQNKSTQIVLVNSLGIAIVGNKIKIACIVLVQLGSGISQIIVNYSTRILFTTINCFLYS